MELEISEPVSQIGSPGDKGDQDIAPTMHFFVVHPAPWMRAELFPAFIRSEMPVFGVDRAEFLPRLCSRYPGSVFYINEDGGAAPQAMDWVHFLGGVAENFIKSKSTIIFMSRGLEPVRQSALRGLGIRLSFLSAQQSPRTLAGQVHAVASRLSLQSRRKAIRVTCAGGGLEVFNVQVDSQPVRGHIRDISSLGMAAFVVDSGTAMPREGMELEKLQLKLKGALILVDAMLVAVRHDKGQTVWIVLFKWGEDLRSKARIQDFISARLQEELDVLMR